MAFYELHLPFKKLLTSKKKDCSRLFGGCNKMHSTGAQALFWPQTRSGHMGAHVPAALLVTGFISLQLMYSEDCLPMALTYFPFTGWYPGLGRGALIKEN